MTGVAAWTKRAAGLAAAGALAHGAPTVTDLGDPKHLALTFDDGPDSASTPLFLDALDALDEAGVRATFFPLSRLVARSLRGGGTMLLHDSDCTSKPRSWRSTLGALPLLLNHCAEQGWRVGPLRDHGLRETFGRAAV